MKKALTILLGLTFRGSRERMTFGDFAAHWFDVYARIATKPSTFQSYKSIIQNHFVSAFGDLSLTSITLSSIQNYVAKRLEQAKPKTVLNELVHLNTIFKHAMDWGYLEKSPAEKVKRPRVESAEMTILAPEEVNRLLASAQPPYRILFLAAILTGMRRGELLALRRTDIDWASNQIHVTRALWRNQITTPKSKHSIRRIDMTPTLALELKKHILVSPNSELNLIFPNAAGNFMDGGNMVRRHFLPALKRAGVRRVRFHDLRHTNASLRIEQGQNVKYIQSQLGHSSCQVTLDEYGHLMRNSYPEEAIKLDRALGWELNRELVAFAGR